MRILLNRYGIFLSIFLYIWGGIIFCQSNFNDFQSSNNIKLNLYFFNNTAYIDLYDFVNSHNFYMKHYETKDKFEISIKNSKIYFSPSTSFFKINNVIYNLTYPVLQKNNSIFIPALEFYNSLKNANLAMRIIKVDKFALYVSPNIFNISNLIISLPPH